MACCMRDDPAELAKAAFRQADKKMRTEKARKKLPESCQVMHAIPITINVLGEETLVVE